PRWICFITGPTACGKTTIAKGLAQSLGFVFVEGDDYHPPHNREKLSRNEPLTDDDRAAWLDALSKLESPSPDDATFNNANDSLIITCSALKKRYRDVLRHGGARSQKGNNAQEGRQIGKEELEDVRVRFVLLDVDEDMLRQRARERHGHFVGEGLVASQVKTLERPQEGEEGDVLVVEVGKGMGVEDTVREVEKRVREEI
ncbi:carbohydrate kinase, partial [Parathielavia appendiculata]